MGKWYEEADFITSIPWGFWELPRRNEGGEVVHRLRTLTEEWIPWMKEMRFDGGLYRPPV